MYVAERVQIVATGSAVDYYGETKLSLWYCEQLNPMWDRPLSIKDRPCRVFWVVETDILFRSEITVITRKARLQNGGNVCRCLDEYGGFRERNVLSKIHTDYSLLVIFQIYFSKCFVDNVILQYWRLKSMQTIFHFRYCKNLMIYLIDRNCLWIHKCIKTYPKEHKKLLDICVYKHFKGDLTPKNFKK